MSFDGVLSDNEIEALLQATEAAGLPLQEAKSSDIICTENFCSTEWGAWVSSIPKSKFDSELWNRYFEYVRAYDLVGIYLHGSEGDLNATLLAEAKALLSQVPPNFACQTRDDFTGEYNRYYLDAETPPGYLRMPNECSSDRGVTMFIQPIEFDGYECVWGGGICVFQWAVKSAPLGDDVGDKLVRAEVSLSALNPDQLEVGDILQISGEIRYIDSSQRAPVVTDLSEVRLIAKGGLEFIDAGSKDYGDDRRVIEASIMSVLGDLLSKSGGPPEPDTGFVFQRNVRERLGEAITEKWSLYKAIEDASNVPDRQEYVIKVLGAYNMFLSCAGRGMLGEVSSAYITAKFENSKRKYLTEEELASFGEGEAKLAQLMVDEEFCEFAMLGISMFPDGLEQLIFDPK
jgi:hypothetical protein